MTPPRHDDALPRKRVGSGALFRDAAGRALLVNPTYKDPWEIPGGVVEAGESPRDCCTREVLEELGLDLPVGRLLVVDWMPALGDRSEGLLFVFDGGVLDEAATGRIRLAEGELSEWRWVGSADLGSFVREGMARRVAAALGAAASGATAYLEWGAPAAERRRPGLPPAG